MEDYHQQIPPIADILQAEKDDLPALYFYHAFNGKAVKFPLPLTDAQKISPGLLLDWTYMAELQINLEGYQQQLAWKPPKPEEGQEPIPEMTEDYKKMIKEYIGHTEKDLASAVKQFKKTYAGLKTENLFADNMDQNKEVCTAHLMRIEQCLRTELFLDFVEEEEVELAEEESTEAIIEQIEEVEDEEVVKEAPELVLGADEAAVEAAEAIKEEADAVIEEEEEEEEEEEIEESEEIAEESDDSGNDEIADEIDDAVEEEEEY